MSFQVFPEGCDRGIVSDLEGERVQKNWGIVTERTGEVFDLWTVQSKVGM